MSNFEFFLLTQILLCVISALGYGYYNDPYTDREIKWALRYGHGLIGSYLLVFGTLSVPWLCPIIGQTCGPMLSFWQVVSILVLTLIGIGVMLSLGRNWSGYRRQHRRRALLDIERSFEGD